MWFENLFKLFFFLLIFDFNFDIDFLEPLKILILWLRKNLK